LFLKWIQWTEQISFIIQLAYLGGIFVGLAIRGVLMSLLGKEEFGFDDLGAIFILSLIIWVFLFRQFIISIFIGFGYIMWIIIYRQSMDHSKITIGASVFLILYGITGLMNVI